MECQWEYIMGYIFFFEWGILWMLWMYYNYFLGGKRYEWWDAPPEVYQKMVNPPNETEILMVLFHRIYWKMYPLVNWHYYHAIHGKTHELSTGPCSNSQSVSHYQRVYPIKSHSTTIFLWFSYGFPSQTVGHFQRVTNLLRNFGRNDDLILGAASHCWSTCGWNVFDVFSHGNFHKKQAGDPLVSSNVASWKIHWKW